MKRDWRRDHLNIKDKLEVLRIEVYIVQQIIELASFYLGNEEGIKLNTFSHKKKKEKKEANLVLIGQIEGYQKALNKLQHKFKACDIVLKQNKSKKANKSPCKVKQLENHTKNSDGQSKEHINERTYSFAGLPEGW